MTTPEITTAPVRCLVCGDVATRDASTPCRECGAHPRWTAEPFPSPISIPAEYRADSGAIAAYITGRNQVKILTTDLHGLAREAYAEGWAEANRDAHTANLDGSHDEMPTRADCPGCGHSKCAECGKGKDAAIHTNHQSRSDFHFFVRA